MKKILAMAMILVLALSCFSITAFAEEPVEDVEAVEVVEEVEAAAPVAEESEAAEPAAEPAPAEEAVNEESGIAYEANAEAPVAEEATEEAPAEGSGNALGASWKTTAKFLAVFAVVVGAVLIIYNKKTK